MIKIRERLSSVGLCTVVNQHEVPMDDYVFHMVLRKGPMVSSPGVPLYVEVLDLVEAPGRLIFRMSMLDASATADQWPAFENEGLAGQWRLQGTTGLLKFVQVYEGSAESTKAFLLDETSHTFVRSRYESALGTK